MPDHNLPSDAFQTFSTNSYNSPSSSGAQPIPAHLFAEAIKELPVDTLYAKAAEIQNSISHMLESNIQLKPFADDGDEDCKEAIAENDQVLKRMEERIELLKTEAEQRGLAWSAHGSNTETVANGSANATLTNGNAETPGQNAQQAAPSGRLTDEELRRQLEAQMAGGDDDDEGVHL